MRNNIQNISRLLVCLTLALLAKPVQLQAEDGPFRKALSKIAEREIKGRIKGKKFRLVQGPFSGQIAAIKPDKHLKIEIKKFELGNDLLTLRVKAKAQVSIEGTLKQSGEKIAVAAVADVELTIEATAKFLQGKGKFYVLPSVKDLEPKLDIKKLSPKDLNGGSGLLTRLANLAFKNRKKEILKKLNKSLKKQEVKL